MDPNRTMMNERFFNYDDPSHDVPAAALRLDATAELGERSNDQSKTAPIRMRARSGDPIDHWYFGRVVHDMDGFELTGDKSRLALLYEHSEPIGYALSKNIDVENGDMELSGTLVETRNSNRATDVIDWMAAGVPFEASISFAGDAPVMEILKSENDETEVNGKQFKGPGVVIRKWKLREVSVVTSGADDDTESALFNQSDSVSVEFIQTERNSDMAKEDLFSGVVEEVIEESNPVEAEVEETVEAETDNDSEAKAETPEEETSEDESAVEASALSTPASKYIEQFGLEQGSVYFATGVPFVEALGKHLKAQEETINDLKGKLSNVAHAGEDMPLSPSDEPKPKERALKLPSWMK